jgi:hypothetical protein
VAVPVGAGVYGLVLLATAREHVEVLKSVWRQGMRGQGDA